MKIRREGLLLAAACVLFAGSPSFAAGTKVTLSKVHICCGGCVKGIEKAVSKVDGVKITADRKTGTVAIEAPDDKTAQIAVNRVARAGYHGVSSSKTIKVRDNSRVKKGKLTELKLTGLHNCCGKCVKAVTTALEKVAGVKGVEIKPKSRSFTVSGDFEGTAVIKALNDVGFHVSKPRERKKADSSGKKNEEKKEKKSEKKTKL